MHSLVQTKREMMQLAVWIERADRRNATDHTGNPFSCGDDVEGVSNNVVGLNSLR